MSTLSVSRPWLGRFVVVLFLVLTAAGGARAQQWDEVVVPLARQPFPALDVRISYNKRATVGGQQFTCLARNLSQQRVAVALDLVAYTVCGTEVSKHMEMELAPGKRAGNGGLMDDTYLGQVQSSDCKGVKFRFYSEDVHMEVEGTNRIRTVGYRNFTLKTLADKAPAAARTAGTASDAPTAGAAAGDLGSEDPQRAQREAQAEAAAQQARADAAVKQQYQQRADGHLKAADNSTGINKDLNLSLAEIDATAAGNKAQAQQLRQAQNQRMQETQQQLVQSTAALANSVAGLIAGNATKKAEREKSYRNSILNSQRYSEQEKFRTLAISYEVHNDYNNYRLYIEKAAEIGSLWALKDIIDNYRYGKNGYIKGDSSVDRKYRTIFTTLLLNTIDTISSLKSYSVLRDDLFKNNHFFASGYMDASYISRFSAWLAYNKKGGELGNLVSASNLFRNYTRRKNYVELEKYMTIADSVLTETLKSNPNILRPEKEGGIPDQNRNNYPYLYDIVDHYGQFAQLYDGSIFPEKKNSAKAINYYQKYLNVLNLMLIKHKVDGLKYRNVGKDGVKATIEATEAKIKTLSKSEQ